MYFFAIIFLNLEKKMSNKTIIYPHINNLILNSSNFINPTKANSNTGIRDWEFYDYSLLLCCIFGTIGNILSIIVMRSKRMRNTNASLFVTCMAVSDIFVLLLKFISMLLKMYKINIFSSCVYLDLFANSFAYISVWLVIIISIERFTAVIYPLKVAIIFSQRKVQVIIGLMVTFFVALSSSRSFCGTPNQNTPYYCSDVKNTFCLNYNNKIYPWIKSTLLSWLPSLLGATLNTIIIVALFKASKNRKNITNTSASIKKNEKTKGNNNVQITSNEKNNHSPNKEKQITIMLLTISITFVIFTLPFAVHELWRKIKRSSTRSYLDKQSQRAVMVLFDLNHSMNFIFYCLTAERFRDELRRIFCGGEKKSKNSTTASTYNQKSNIKSMRVDKNKLKETTETEYLNQNDSNTDQQSVTKKISI